MQWVVMTPTHREHALPDPSPRITARHGCDGDAPSTQGYCTCQQDEIFARPLEVPFANKNRLKRDWCVRDR